MKKFDLNKLCGILKIPRISDKPIIIKNVKTSISQINDNTLIFHLRKTETLNVNRLSNLENCFIITDQVPLKEFRPVRNKMIYVNDIEEAYRKFIDFYRNRFNIKTVAITGTCGKSTTKEMIKQTLAQNYHTIGTVASKNSLRYNHDYLMEMDDNTEYGIYEVALTNPGQIIHTSRFFKPSIGVITNIGIDHLSGCRTLDNYILAKGEMLTALGDKGTLIINNDDENIKKLDFSVFKGKIVTFGIRNKSDIYADNIKFKDGEIHFVLNNKYYVKVPGLGIHNVYNALAALSVLNELKIDIHEAIKGLEKYQPMKSHFEIIRGINNSIIVDDTWSSNPTSVKAALETMHLVKGTKVLVIGYISYLGDHALAQAKEIGKMVVKYKIDYLVTIDNFSKHIGLEAIRQGMDESRVFHCQNEDELNSVLYHLLEPNVYVLFKTSMFDRKIGSIINKVMLK